MSEIDFAEIEKAMAELVNKAQGKERHEGLQTVAKERSQKAKETEVAQEQADIATKRIVIATNNIRSNPSPRPRPAKVAPTQASGRVMDFKAPTSSPIPVILPPKEVESITSPTPEEVLGTKEEADLQKTVGELSNEYLVGEVTEDNNDSFEGQQEEPDMEMVSSDEESSSAVPINSSSEDVTGSSPVTSPMQEPIMGDLSALEGVSQSTDDKLPEADMLAEDIGKVHKIYGQKLPKEYLQTQKKDFSKDKGNAKNSSKPKKLKQKRGFSFYFVLLMIVAATAVWGLAAYLYFIY